MRIDAHQHFWKLERNDYGWLSPEQSVLYRDYLPHDLSPLLQEQRIDRTILVQAAPTVEETEFMLELYDQHEWIGGVVGWLDLESSQFTQEFNRLRQHSGFVGIRPMLQDLEDEQWILRPQVLKNLERLASEDFPIDILVFPRHLPHIITLFEKLPSLRGVIDHAAKPNIAASIVEPWKEHMSQLARFDQVMCKLSGLITEADHKHWHPDDLAPYVHHIVDQFGAYRVMFGSDWPVCLLAGSYQEVHDALLRALPNHLNESDLEAVYGQNAAQFYGLRN